MHSDTCYAPLCLNKSQKTDLSLVHMEKACTAHASTPTAVRYSTVHHCTVHFFTLHYSALLYSATADLSKKIKKISKLGLRATSHLVLTYIVYSPASLHHNMHDSLDLHAFMLTSNALRQSSM